MGLKEGSIVPINLYCGHEEVRVTLLPGKQSIKCSNPKCNIITLVKVETNSDGEVINFKVTTP